ncbi:MAG: hypothetical protein SGI74_08390 [Oligoflexia bacterium]|nr:hypothetical protein [Oligoflexia bacterium]
MKNRATLIISTLIISTLIISTLVISTLVTTSIANATQSQGVYQSQSIINPDDPSRFSNGCNKPGEPLSKRDSSVNTSFVKGIKIWRSSKNMNTSTQTELTVDESNGQGYDLTLTYLNSTGIPELQPNVSVQEKWRLKIPTSEDSTVMFGRVYHPTRGIPYFNVKFFPAHLGRFTINPPKGCTTFDTGTNNTITSTVGTFTFAKTGQTVKAFKRKFIQKNIMLECYETFFWDNAKKAGLGDFTRIVISSNEVPSPNPNCGGDSVFVYEKAVNANGEVLSEQTTEMLGFK